MPKTYLFYDLETTGLNKAFDQIMTFAGLRTDENLNVISRETVTVRLRPDVIPSPSAMITHRIPRQKWFEGMCEFEAIGRIHKWLNAPGTISVGYNSLGFDDEFLRFSFYRNLLPPYTHQYRNGCRRLDILPIAITYWLYQPEGLIWPQTDGKPTLKLEYIAAANHLTEGPSHDAASDAEATLRLTRLLMAKSEMWQYLEGCFRKDVDYHRLKQLPVRLDSAVGEHRFGLMIASEFGTNRLFQAPVLSLGDSIPYPNQSLWLRLDLERLPETNGDSISETTWVVRKRFGEPGILLPPLDRYLTKLDPERIRLVEANIAWLEQHRDILKAIAEHHRSYRYPFVPDLDADAALYQVGFFPKADEALGRRFNRLKPSKMTGVIDQFSNPTARTLAVRVIGRNYPDLLPPEWRSEYEAYLAGVDPGPSESAITDYAGRCRTTPQAALAELERLLSEDRLDEKQRQLLNDLEGYITGAFGDRPRSGARPE
jgi:exodeoxyribonuclease-1